MRSRVEDHHHDGISAKRYPSSGIGNPQVSCAVWVATVKPISIAFAR